MLLAKIRRMGKGPCAEALVQIPVQFFQPVFFEVQEFDLSQELSFLHDCGDTVSDNLDDFLRSTIQQGWDHQLHGDFFVLADVVLAEYAHPLYRDLVCNAFMDIDSLVLFSAVAQETHSPVRRILRISWFPFHLSILPMVNVAD
jgi:hypothetical protein